MALTMLGTNTVTTSPARLGSAAEALKTTNVKRANEVSKWDETFESGTQYLTDGEAGTFKVKFYKNVPIDLEGSIETELPKLFAGITATGTIAIEDGFGDSINDECSFYVGDGAAAKNYATNSYGGPAVFIDVSSNVGTTGADLIQWFKGDEDLEMDFRLVVSDDASAVYVTEEPYYLGVSEFSLVPALEDGGEKTITVNSDSHYTEEEILELVTAQDLFGQPCDIDVLESDYEDAVGTYTIKLQATDDYGQTATCTLKIVVLDRTAPVVVKKGDHTINYGQVVNEADIFACISATDNSGVQPTNSIYNNGGFSHFGTATTAADVGTYTIVVRTKDASGNFVDTNITLKVLDKTAPVISKKTGTTEDQIQYGFSESYGLTEQALLSLYTATDEVDGSVDLYVKSGEVINSIGQHNITIAARDDAGNESSLVVNYVIRADIPPVFILDERLVLVSNENPLTKEQIQTIVEAMAPEGATYITLNEEDVAKYSSGAELVGEQFRINYNYQIDGEEEIKSDYITLEIDEVETTEEHGWWDTFIHFWKVLWDVISDFFKGENPSWSQSWEEVEW